MINWQSGKAGFVGGDKRLILGFFNYSYKKPPPVLTTPASRKIVVLASTRTVTVPSKTRTITADL